MYPVNKGPLSDVPNSGPAPVLLRWRELQKVVPDWKRLTAHIEAHPESKEKLGEGRHRSAYSPVARPMPTSFCFLDRDDFERVADEYVDNY
jgi:hypothetical protein